MNEYEYKGNKYTLKPDVLELFRDGIELIIGRKKLMFEETKNINSSLILQYEKQHKELLRSKSKAEKSGKGLSEIEKQIDELQYKYETDPEVHSILTHTTGCVENAMLKLVLDKKLIPEVIPKLIEGDKETYNFNDIEFSKNVVSKVVNDFFFLMMTHRDILPH